MIPSRKYLFKLNNKEYRTTYCWLWAHRFDALYHERLLDMADKTGLDARMFCKKLLPVPKFIFVGVLLIKLQAVIPQLYEKESLVKVPLFFVVVGMWYQHFFYTERICKELLRETPGMLSKGEQNSCPQTFYNASFQHKFIFEIYRTTFLVVVIYWF